MKWFIIVYLLCVSMIGVGFLLARAMPEATQWEQVEEPIEEIAPSAPTFNVSSMEQGELRGSYTTLTLSTFSTTLITIQTQPLPSHY